MCSFFVILLPALAILPFISCTETEVVTTASGPIQGQIVASPDGTPVSAFLGIPYAVPPVGELRFSPPLKAEPWTTTFNATQSKPACYQQSMGTVVPEMHMSEDCLTLNVFAPHPKPTNAPVVVFIHEGGFRIGHPLRWLDHTILSSRGVIIVAINYRLGVFGFFGLGREEAPGNVGLLDQHLALQWVQENIEVFGGNRSSVTLMGSSAGSSSVGYHFLSPLSRGLFHRGIMVSGTPVNYWSYVDRRSLARLADNLFTKTRCNYSTDAESLQCLRGKAPEEFTNTTLTFGMIFEPGFLPTIDGRFLTEEPLVSVQTGHLNKGEVLISTASDDGAFVMLDVNPNLVNPQDGHINRTDFLTVIKRSVHGMTDLQAKLLDAVYSDWADPEDPVKLRDSAKAVYNDGQLVCAVNEFSDGLVRSGNDVYRFLFDYKTAAVAQGGWIKDWMKTGHCSELMDLMGKADLRLPETAEDVEVKSKLFQNLLNFIRTGDPNGDSEELHWPKFNAGRQFKHVTASPVVESNYRVQKCAIWTKILPLL